MAREMKKIVRFGVSMDEGLIERFDRSIKEKSYENRSEAIRDLIRKELVEEEWSLAKEIAGGITIVYDHHQRQLANRLLSIQHDFHDLIVCCQHVHLDHHNCLEVMVVKGKPEGVRELFNKLRALKGVRHIGLVKSTTGRELV
ncbi:nickel-responsive transcriptional regulator NikR [Thermodesulfovibrionales bacterium]|nr:nickel-responsive transcriptional regulator NikR [Thermodesulfovibrionales bacterium]MCL0061433.1 nickel-responsive transcriptional regulator NikR [Thermodesulfovibrionales bacterium]MCL0083300.1 nickel-responsive transcriptional regulator NikR [Thermodesulfovibrionales bacterium]MCL0096293.1 nickel-responsive transcriptional regulator NikR [Thermodesulfovibrionales bacterium]MCL0105899.1 nickel-responsive transcriptional regulator NikR [Thermodesulfovibrionales bacterium]